MTTGCHCDGGLFVLPPRMDYKQATYCGGNSFLSIQRVVVDMAERPGALAARLQLRAVLTDDLPMLFEHQRDPDASRMAAFPPRDHDTFYAHWKRIMADPAVFLQTIVVDGQVAGSIVSWESEGKRLIGYWIGKQWWGQGIATAGVAEFLRRFPFRPLHAYVARHNIASIRVLEKCGFARCAELPDLAEARGGEVTDLLFELRAHHRQ